MFNYQIEKQVLTSLVGYIEIAIVEVQTFGEDVDLGKTKFELSKLIAGERDTVHLSIGESDVEVVFELRKAV